MLSSSETKHSSSTIVNTLTSSSVISENTAPLNQENVSGKATKSSQPADVVKTSSINLRAVTSAHSLEATPVKTSSQVVPAVTLSQVTPSQDVVTSSQAVVTTSKFVVTSSEGVATSSQALVTSSQAVATSSQAVVTTSKVVVTSSEGVVTSSQASVTSSQAVVTSSQAMLVVVPDQQRFKASSRVGVTSSGHVGVGMAPTPSSSTAKPAEVATPTVTPRILETSSVATLKASFSSTVRVDSSSSIVSARLSLPAALPVNETSTADVSPGATSVQLTFSSVAATTPPIMPLDKSQYFSFTSYCNLVDHITTSALNALSFFVCLFVFCKLQKRRHWF